MKHPRISTFAMVVAALLAVGGLAQAGPSSSRMTPLVKAIARVRPAVVNIHSEKNVAPASGPFTNVAATPNRLSGMGTGVVVDARGYVVTNYHVIEDVSSIRVTLWDGSTYSAQIVSHDPGTDLALLRIHPRKRLQTMPFGSSDDLMLGETVIAIGNAYGYENTITRGIISELHRDVRLSDHQAYRDLIQTDASINPGNSGGPLINADGEMIGLNVAIRAGAQCIGFAIPVREVIHVVAKLMSVERVGQVWHGLELQPADLDDTKPGKVIIKRITSSSPADKAAIRVGDRLLSVDNESVNTPIDLERILLDRRPYDKIEVTLARGHRQVTTTLVLEPTPSQKDRPGEYVWRHLGVRLRQQSGDSDIKQISRQLRGGMRILEIEEHSPCDRAGMQVGDVLVGLHHWETLSLDNVLYVISRSNKQSLNPVRFFVVRNGQIQRGWLQIPETSN
ncbi:Putative serine protease HhoA precursor [Planctomycetes bacterium Pan216]|uniref:Serine protease HhoA n=1 Tax=Kolteria novifilia TaxID=2527975 RepID=A0A518BAJ8_9BACT|nr:Putative serine protease HhoA precursor [Planctomycetes bacterium Pan216]